MTKRNPVIWWLELVLKLGMLTVGFLQASSLTFGQPIISVFLWPTLLLGGGLLLYRVWHWREYVSSSGFWLLFLFCLSYVVSAAVNIQYGVVFEPQDMGLDGFFDVSFILLSRKRTEGV